MLPFFFISVLFHGRILVLFLSTVTCILCIVSFKSPGKYFFCTFLVLAINLLPAASRFPCHLKNLSLFLYVVRIFYFGHSKVKEIKVQNKNYM